jgi:hypothetical protein
LNIGSFPLEIRTFRCRQWTLVWKGFENICFYKRWWLIVELPQLP